MPPHLYFNLVSCSPIGQQRPSRIMLRRVRPGRACIYNWTCQKATEDKRPDHRNALAHRWPVATLPGRGSLLAAAQLCAGEACRSAAGGVQRTVSGDGRIGAQVGLQLSRRSMVVSIRTGGARIASHVSVHCIEAQEECPWLVHQSVPSCRTPPTSPTSRLVVHTLIVMPHSMAAPRG